MTRRRAQPTYHCPECELELPHGLGWMVVGEIERTGQPVAYECPACSAVVEHVLIRWAR